MKVPAALSKTLTFVFSTKFVGFWVVASGAIAAVIFWTQDRATIKAGPITPPEVAAGVAATLVLVSGLMVREVRESKERPVLLLGLVIALIWLVVCSFAAVYYGIGSTKDANFSCGSHTCLSLSRSEAMYFAIGTLSTAGTGFIAAVGDAQGIQGIQMVVDIAVILFALTAIVARFVNAGSTETAEKPPPEVTPPVPKVTPATALVALFALWIFGRRRSR